MFTSPGWAVFFQCMMKLSIFFCFLLLFPGHVHAQIRWQDVTARFAPLPEGVKVFYSNDSLDGKPFIGYYVEASLKNRQLNFTTQVGNGKRYTPSQYYTDNDAPYVVVNATFFNFDKNQNLNVVVKDGKLLAYNIPYVKGRGRDSAQLLKPFRSAIGITKKRKADIAWIYADTGLSMPRASQVPVNALDKREQKKIGQIGFRKWKVRTAIGGGPILVQDGKKFISNDAEMLFTGKVIDDKHPRTAMGYTAEGRLIIMAIQGRFPGIADGVSLTQAANLLVELGCVEALNLDGGGSTCMLVNGKETVKPSDKEGQRPVPGVFLIKQ
jgi:Phosphodiester glycosidase